MKKRIIALILIVFIVIIIIGCSNDNADDNETSIVWKVEPELEYDKIYYCSDCNLLKDADISDIKTIIETLYPSGDGVIYICGVHGGMTRQFFIDEEKEVVVVSESSDGGSSIYYYTADELNEFRSWPIYNFDSERLYGFRRIDSEKIIEHDYGNGDFGYEFDDAIIDGKYALVQGTTFITNFIYDDYKSKARYRSINFIDFKLNDKWGIVDKTRNILLPFIFDDIEFINDKYAFAKYSGKYGVLDIIKY